MKKVTKVDPLAGTCWPQDKLIIIDKEKQKEWDEMDEGVKKTVLSHLRQSCSMMEQKMAIELLCNCINDMNERILNLEQRVTGGKT